MSATNRGATRIEADNYPTPSWCVRRLLEACYLPRQVPVTGWMALRPARWLEPCAGDGAIIRAVTQHVRRECGDTQPVWEACEIRDAVRDGDLPHVARWVTGDFLSLTSVGAPDVIVTNPPYALARRFVQRCLHAAPAGYVAMLLRLNWLEGAERVELLRAQPPDVYVLPNRPNFVASLSCKGTAVGCGLDACGWRVTQLIDAPRCRICPECGGRVQVSTSDATAYAWFVWGPERARSVGRIQVLASTSEEERRAA